ncbi:MAG: beta-propeller fold lactonase family protein [Vicinamibacteria bacterium]
MRTHSSIGARVRALTLCAASLMTACGGDVTGPNPTPTPGATGKYVYAGSTGSSSIGAYLINATTGALTAIGQATLSDSSRVLSLALDPAGRFLYVARIGDRGGIEAFAINRATGALSPVPGSPFDLDHQADALLIDPNGRYVRAVRTFNFLIDTFSLDGTSGSLTPRPVSTRLDLDFAPAAPVFHPDGKRMYFSAATFSRVEQAAVDASSGTLSAGSFTEVPDTVRSLTVDPTGALLYVTTATPFSSDTLFAYRISATGGLTRWPGSVFASGFDPAANNLRPDIVTFDPTGRFAYVLDRAARTGARSRGVFAFPVQSGLLGPTVLGPYSSPPTPPLLLGDPVAFALDPSGRFAFLLDQSASTVSSFVVDSATGSWTPSGMAVTTPRNSSFLVVTQ